MREKPREGRTSGRWKLAEGRDWLARGDGLLRNGLLWRGEPPEGLVGERELSL